MSGELADHLEAAASEAVQALRRLDQPRDWVDEIQPGGDVLRVDGAAFVAGIHPDTLRDRAKAASASGKPIGYLVAGAVWLISRHRLLDWIEAHEGRAARLAAETRARKSAETGSLPEKSIQNRVVTGV